MKKLAIRLVFPLLLFVHLGFKVAYDDLFRYDSELPQDWAADTERFEQPGHGLEAGNFLFDAQLGSLVSLGDHASTAGMLAQQGQLDPGATSKSAVEMQSALPAEP